MKPFLSVEDLHIFRNKREIIKGVGFCLRERELCALLGLNGSGKTTILHGICGLIPLSGCLYADGCLINDYNEKKRAQLISFLPQNCNLDVHLTVLEIVMMGFNARLRLFEYPSKAQKEEALLTLKKLGIGELADRDFSKISQGQKQIALLARGIVQDAPIMILDEPDSSLDYLNKRMILKKIKEIIKNERKAGLVTLHDPNIAMEYCDRLILLSGGKIIGEIDMHSDGQSEIEEKLSLLYGDVKLARINSKYLIIS